jgi:hypothetical protein
MAAPNPASYSNNSVRVTCFATTSFDSSVFGPGSGGTFQGIEPHPTKDPRAYFYLNIRAFDTLIWTLGASYDNYREETFHDSSFSPKFGVQWTIRPDLEFRAAAFQVVKPYLANNHSLEPTQVAGFNQLFDDYNGTKSRRYGLGLDWKATRNLKAGIELTYRTRFDPTQDVSNATWLSETRHEQNHRLYMNWTPTDRLAARAEFVFDSYRSQQGIATDSDNLPLLAITRSLPLSLTYFDPNGFFGGVVATYVNQSVRRSPLSTEASGQSGFTVVDASIGYRLPKRYGVLSLSVKNLFDRQFKYQDDSYRDFGDQPSIGPYFPVRTFMARFTGSF